MRYDRSTGHIRYYCLSKLLFQRRYETNVSDMCSVETLKQSNPELAAKLPRFLNVYDTHNKLALFIEPNDLHSQTLKSALGLTDEHLLPLT